MKVLIYGINYSPELTGIAKYSTEMAEWLLSQGHEVQVITAPPYYPQWKILKGYRSWFYSQHVLNGVRVWRCPLWVPARPSGFKRILHLFSFAFTSFPVIFSLLFRGPNVVLVIEPPLFCAPAVLLAAFFYHTRTWLHIQDFEVDAAFELGILSSKNLRKSILKIESWLMQKFDRVSTISDQMLVRLENKGVSPTKQILFPNWVDTNHIYPKESSADFRSQFDIPVASTVFLYSGNMGEKQGLEIIIEASQKLKNNKNIIFVMCGQGAAYNRLYEMSIESENIRWLELQPIEKLNDLLNMADVHLLPQRANAADLVMPSKLTGMLASGKPVLATALEGTQIAEVLENSGVIVPPEDLCSFVKEIKELAINEEKRRLLGENAREYAVNNLGKEAVLSRFEESLLECVQYKN